MTIEARFQQSRGGFTLDVSFDAPASGVTAIFGPSGSGKTTILRAIAGLDRIPGGYLAVNGEHWQQTATFLAPHRRPVGYVFQEASLFPHLNVAGNLRYGARRARGPRRQSAIDEAVEMLGIAHLVERDTQTLSGGERQRVAIARALSVHPKLLLMDEPLAALEQSRKQELLPYIERLHRELKIPVLYVSHDAGEVMRLADHMVMVDGGTIAAQGPLNDLLTHPDLPPAHAPDAGAVIEATVSGREEDWALTRLIFSGGEILTPGAELPVGRTLRVRVAARDVSLTLSRQQGTSILNVIPVRVVEIEDEAAGQVLVTLQAGKVRLLSRVTRRSAAELELRPGARVFAQIKSIALLD